MTDGRTDRRTDGRTDGQNYDSQDRASIAASRRKNGGQGNDGDQYLHNEIQLGYYEHRQ